jgi:hypothetical protein
MHIEIVGADLPLVEVTRVVRRMAEELGWEAHWDGKLFQVRQGGCTPARGCHEDGLDAVHADGGRESRYREYSGCIRIV